VVRAEAPQGLRLLTHPVTWLDVFTATPLTGNGLAVVHAADDLDNATMLAFARETRLSETTFVQTAGDPAADYRNRIWVMAGELPFAGHPSLGTAVAVALERGVREASLVQQTHAGLQPIDVVFSSDTLARASMLQEPAVFGAELGEEALAVVGLRGHDADPALPAQVVSTGLTHALIPVADAEALTRCLVDRATLDAFLTAHGCVTAYVAHTDRATGTVIARAFFIDPLTASEDPATGSAAGPLCALLARHAGIERITVHQGVQMGRPSRIDAALAADRVRVGGDVVVLMRGTLTL
jgi:trans-2,3-dihydro-3-hydroxyanthranilate isomerase